MAAVALFRREITCGGEIGAPAPARAASAGVSRHHRRKSTSTIWKMENNMYQRKYGSISEMASAKMKKIMMRSGVSALNRHGQSLKAGGGEMAAAAKSAGENRRNVKKRDISYGEYWHQKKMKISKNNSAQLARAKWLARNKNRRK
jgi:N-acyl-L-homoserine lactone synthetase